MITCNFWNVMFLTFFLPLFSLAEGYRGGWIPSTGQCRHQRGLWHRHRPNLLGLTGDDCPRDQRRVSLLRDWPEGPGEWLGVGGGGHTRGYGGSHSNDYTVPELLPGFRNPVGTQIWTSALWEETLLPGKRKELEALQVKSIPLYWGWFHKRTFCLVRTFRFWLQISSNFLESP